MSESDDSDIQADIQALTEALSLPTTSDSQQQFASSHSRSDSTPSIDFERSDNDYLKYIDVNQDTESLDAYDMNAQLITGLLMAKNKLMALLQECERKIKELDEKMNSSEGSSLRTTSRFTITNAGIPYFKDKNHFRAPKNYDTKLKESRGELFLPFLRKPSRWSGRDWELLLRAIHNEAIESVLSEGFIDDIDKQPDKETSNDQAKTALVLPRNFREMVGAIGEKEFDWHKISRMDFEDKHSPGECQAMWNTYLHPDFNKNEWTSVEDKRLLRYARECKCQDWDTITQLLGTSRSAYQCFIRYNTIKKTPFSGLAWAKEEDKCLAKVISELRIGDYIPWTDIANHMRHRTKQQVYTRWMYRKAPHLRKGRFTYVETKTLMNAVEKYGTDFCKISNVVMPYRTSIQLNERYQTVMTATNGDNMWTLNDDERLLQLHRRHNNDWSRIATFFSNKSRTQVRHRFKAIERYLRKNVSLKDIPRPSTSSKKNDKVSTPTNTLIIEMLNNRDASVAERPVIHIDDIRLRLYEFISLPPSKTINSKKIYDSKQLVYDTRRLYDMLNVLNANLDLSSSFLNYTVLNRREKQLLVSLEEYINVRNNEKQNHEQIEKFRMQMFGRVSEKVNESSFIPPLPSVGYVRTKKGKSNNVHSVYNNQSIDCELIDVNEKFLIDVPTEFSTTPYIDSFVSVEEEIQFHKFSRLLISDYHKCDERHVNLHKLLKCNLSFDKAGASSEYHNSTDVDSKLTKNQKKRSKKLQTFISTEHTKEEDDEENIFGDIIAPNRATLLGIKNLLLWKLLYDCQHNSEHCELLLKSEQQETTTNCPIQTESVEYRLLQTRLLQLFKLPIGLSNTILELCGPEPIFLTKKEDNQTPVSRRKRKFENVEAADPPVVRNCKVVYNKYKIIAK